LPVDAGPIVGFELFQIQGGSTVQDLEQLTYLHLVRLFRWLARPFACRIEPLPMLPVSWKAKGEHALAPRAAPRRDRTPARADAGVPSARFGLSESLSARGRRGSSLVQATALHDTLVQRLAYGRADLKR
jgi:hypothetical protein